MEIKNTFCSTGDFTVIHRLNGESLKIEDEWSEVEENRKDKWAILKCGFEYDAEVAKFIQGADIEDIIKLIVKVDSKGTYILNIHSVEKWSNYGIVGERWMAKRQLEIYLPIIKYFLLYGFDRLFSFTEDIKGVEYGSN